MRILALDTTTPAGSIAVLEAAFGDASGAKLLGLVGTRSTEAYSSRLFRQLEFLLAELRLTTADFDLFGVAAGPGTFTGLRVGLTAVKGWAEVHKRPIAAVSALEALAWQGAKATGNGAPASRIVAVEDARRGQLYGGTYEQVEGRLRRMADDVVMSAEELWPHLQQTLGATEFVFATTTPEFLHSAVAPSVFRGRAIVPVSNVLAPTIGELAWHKAQHGETCDALTLDAHYVRRSDAELLWKG